MSRFMFEDDDPERDLLGGTVQQKALIYLCANEMMILLGCSQCERRLMENGKRIRGSRMVYPPETNRQTAVGKPLCAQCFRKAVK